MVGFDTLAGRLIGSLLAALLAAQVASVALFSDQQESRERLERERQFLRQAKTASRILDGMPPDARKPSVPAFNGPGFTFHLEYAKSATTPPSADEIALLLPDEPGPLPPGLLLTNMADRRSLSERFFNFSLTPPVRVGERPPPPPPRREDTSADERPPPLSPEQRGQSDMFGGYGQGLPPGPPPRRAPRPGQGPGPGPEQGQGEGLDPGPAETPYALPAIDLSIPLSDGQWLNGRLYWPSRPPAWMVPLMAQAILTAIALTVIVVLLVRANTRSLKQLARSANQVGRGEDIGTLEEKGPAEIKRTIHAFNTMTERLRRMIQGRTRLLAAISHDLRTPITALRIRAELVEDRDNRERMLAMLEEMHALAEASLTLAREDSVTEETQVADLGALVQSVCDDLSDVGQPVTVQDAPRLPYPCRVNSMKRALRNLVENAVKYGSRADVAVQTRGGNVVITVDDQGPGIPDAQMERMFQPFVRLEESRSRETGGFGLGLTIARSIVHAHGGELTLSNRDSGGLRASIVLPV